MVSHDLSDGPRGGGGRVSEGQEWVGKGCGGALALMGGAKKTVPEPQQLHNPLSCMRGTPCLEVVSMGDTGQEVAGRDFSGILKSFAGESL